MTPQEWQRVKELLDEVLECEAEERRRRLETTRDTDPTLALEVERLLAVDAELGDFIEEPAFDIHDRDDPAVRVGQTLGPWRLVQQLGSGGMGAVYLAVRDDDEFEQTVAVKVLKRGLDTEEVIHRFRTERQILAGLDHPNIARLYDGGTTPDGRPYLVMERVEGRPVDVYCHDEGLGVDERLDLFLTVCDAVQFAHRNLVVHRDLKPSNILVNADGVPKLLDFGIARLLSPERGQALPTVGAWRFFTPEYASPEQLQGQPVTTASDVYSLGVLLHLLLTDHRPYEPDERSALGMLRALDAGEPPRPSSVAPVERRRRLRGDLDNIVRTALRREPDRRYGSADQLADDVRRFLDGLPVRATPDSWTYRAGKFVRRHRVGVTAAAAIAVLLVGFVAVASVLTQQAESEKNRAQRMVQLVEEFFAQAAPDAESGGEIDIRDAIDKAWRTVAEGDGDALLRAQFLQTIGNTYLSWRNEDAARPLFLEALKIRLREVGGDDPLAAESLSSLAFTYKEAGDEERAQAYLSHAIAIERAHRPQGHPELLSLLNNQAVLLSELGRYEEAERLYREIIEERERVVPGGSLEVASNYHNLGAVLRKEGKFVEAEKCFERAVDLRRRHDADASALSKSLNGLASSRQDQGRNSEAMFTFQEVARDLELISTEHPELATTYNNIGVLYLEEWRGAEAEREFRKALAVPVDDHPVMLMNLASALIEQRKVDEAQSILARLGQPPGWRRYEFESMEGAILTVRGQYAEAEPVLVHSCEKMLEAPGLDKFNTQLALHRLITLYEAWNKPAEVSKWRRILGGQSTPLPPELPQPEQPGT